MSYLTLTHNLERMLFDVSIGRSKVTLYTCTYLYLRVPTCTYVYLRVPKTHMLTELTEILNHQYSDAILNRL